VRKGKSLMETIEFSIFDHGAEAVGVMRALLARLERERHIRVNLEVIPWAEAWTRLLQMALYNDGPSVSEIGSTWVSDMVMMNALRPFTEGEVARLGGKESYLPASWHSVRAAPGNGNAVAWAIPWLADTRLLYYRKDILARAAQPERESFASHAELETCLQALQESGVAIPLTLATRSSRINLHFLATWIWAEGADFLTPDGKTAIFDSPAALEGMSKFFRLARFLAPEARRLNDVQSDALFWQGRAALAFSGPWLFDHPQMSAEQKEQVAVAAPPGVPFVGGFHLIIWKYTRQQEAALELIDYLAGHHPPQELFPSFSLPARLETLSQGRFATHPVYGVMARALRAGHSFPAAWLWGMLENRLYEALQFLWEQALTMSEAEFRPLLESQIRALAQRINASLQT